MDVQDIKNRFGIIGNSPLLNRAIDIARQVAPTDISVLITGESGSGKEVFSHIIHSLSARKHGPFIAVNCGAIPEGTIDSELFGHEKGSFTGASDARKGYFEVVDGGTMFLDEVAELPIGTQARLLRVLETGEYIRVGSSKVQKTNVRVIAATNKDVFDAVMAGKFREDLYYRLNTVPLKVPPLRERKEDINLLFRKFIADFTDKYRSPSVQLDQSAQQMLMDYSWPGNVRQLKNIAEQIAVLEKERNLSAPHLLNYIPNEAGSTLPMRIPNQEKDDFSERDILYKVLFDMKKDMTDLKKLVADIIQNGGNVSDFQSNQQVINQLYRDIELPANNNNISSDPHKLVIHQPNDKPFEITHEAEEVEESLSLVDKESDLIKKALRKHKGKRKLAARESESQSVLYTEKLKNLNYKYRIMYQRLKYFGFCIIFPAIFLFQSCGVYTFSGASIPEEMKTISVQFFENNAALVVPYLSQQFTDALKDRIRSQSRLSIIRAEADANFEGRITDYSVRPVAIQGNDRAGLTRITVTVQVKYTNALKPEGGFEESFSANQEFSLNQGSLESQQQKLITLINRQLSELIFNRAFANWE